jgi:hypothetical protein
VIAFLTAAVAAANFYVAYNTEQAKCIRTEDLLRRVTQAKEALQAEKEELVRAKEALDAQVVQLAARAKDVENQFIQEKRAREALTAELAQARKEAGQGKSQLEGERKEKQVLSDELSKAKQSYTAISNELTLLRQAKEALEKRVKEMLAVRAKEAEQIVVTPLSSAPVVAQAPSEAAKQSGLEGKVLVVNREYGFIVVNLGSRDGVRKGSRFTVIRAGKTVASAEADKIYDGMTAANLLGEEKKSDAAEGDVVRLAV